MIGKLTKKSIIYFLLGVITLIIILSFFVVDKKENVNNNKKIPIAKNYQDKNLKSLLAEFELSYKKALVYSEKSDFENTFLNLKEALEIWRTIYKKYKNNSTPMFYNTKDWSKKIEIIYENLVSANANLKSKDFLKTKNELEKVRIDLRDLRRENNIKNINDLMLDFYEDLKPVVESPDKKSSLIYMKDMKISFLFIKENLSDEKYLEKVSEIEDSISKIDSSVASDFKKYQKKILTQFDELYLLVE